MQYKPLLLIKKALCLLLATLLCGVLAVSSLEAARPFPALPPYVVVPKTAEHDSYILTQLFLAAFDAKDIETIQRLVRQGMLSSPQEFPHFMNLVLHLVKQPDSRLFMLLSPVSEHIANPSRPVDISALLHLSGLISGQILPGGKMVSDSPEAQKEREEQLLRQRIKFYDEDLATAPASPARSSSGGAEDQFGQESLLFEKGTSSGSQFIWTRSPYPGSIITSTAVDARLANGTLWGGVRQIAEESNGFISEQNMFFVIRNGIIGFAQPRNVEEEDFYADEQPRPHEILNTEVMPLELHAPCPCQMQVQSVRDNDGWPPRMVLYLAQSNARPDESDFLCRAQCVLTYNWDGGEYVLSRKMCVDENAFGIWPYSPEIFDQFFPPAGELQVPQ